MASRTAKVAWSIVAGILAGVPLIAPRSAANAAECLTEPGKTAPQGQHWHYRIEHGTKRHCWYTRDEGAKAAEAGPTDDESAQQAPKTAETSEDPSRSIEDARAEYPMPQARANTIAAPAPAPTPLPAQNPAPLASSPNPPQADAQGSTIASRWPSPETAAAPPAIAPAAPQVTAQATDPAPAADAASDAPADSAAPAPATAAAITAPARPPSVSLQMLFAVIGAALALAGLTASLIYRFGRRRQQRLDTRERRAVLWEGVETGPTPPWIEPVMEAETAPQPLPERRATQVVRSQQRYEKIEEILAQLVKQGQQSDA